MAQSRWSVRELLCKEVRNWTTCKRRKLVLNTEEKKSLNFPLRKSKPSAATQRFFTTIFTEFTIQSPHVFFHSNVQYSNK